MNVIVIINLLIFASFNEGALAAETAVHIFINGRQIIADVSPIIVKNRTMVPLRAISEGLGARVEWQDAERRVVIDTPGVSSVPDMELVPIMGESAASADDLRSLLKKNNPKAPDLVDLYLQIGKEYGIRGDIAFCQAAKETGWWQFKGSVQASQNNYCGLGASGIPATGLEDLRSADATRVCYVPGKHGAVFATPADGVEAHIQHLYAYACKKKLPAGKTIVDPRFTLVNRGSAPNWTDLNGRWAVPGVGYGQSILNDYFKKAMPAQISSVAPKRNDSNNGNSQTIQIYIDGQELLSDVSPMVVNGRTMVPLRAISEGLGAEVEWQADSRRVIINHTGR